MIDALIADFYAAAAGRIDWKKPFDDLASQMDLWAVQVIGVNKQTGGLIFSSEGGRASAESALDYIREFHTSNPRIEPLLATTTDQWMHCHEHFDEDYVSKNAFFQDFLIPYGGRYLSATKLIENEDVMFLFGAMRGHRSQPLGASDMPSLMSVKHHLTEAFKNLMALRKAYSELSIAQNLLSQFNYPMVLLDQTRGLLLKNAAASELLAAGSVITERSGILVCRDKESDAALTEAVHALACEGTASPAPARQVVKLKKADGSPYLAFVSRLLPEQTMGAFGNMACALVVFHDPVGSSTTFNPFIVGECFHLTPAEARVAVAIAQGSSAKEIAQETGAALPTVRSHLQRVMEKTGVTRQADLIRVLMAIPSRVA